MYIFNEKEKAELQDGNKSRKDLFILVFSSGKEIFSIETNLIKLFSPREAKIYLLDSSLSNDDNIRNCLIQYLTTVNEVPYLP